MDSLMNTLLMTSATLIAASCLYAGLTYNTLPLTQNLLTPCRQPEPMYRFRGELKRNASSKTNERRELPFRATKLVLRIHKAKLICAKVSVCQSAK